MTRFSCGDLHLPRRATTNQGRGWTNLFTVRLFRYSCRHSRLVSYLRDFTNLIIYHEQIVRYRSQIFLVRMEVYSTMIAICNKIIIVCSSIKYIIKYMICYNNDCIKKMYYFSKIYNFPSIYVRIYSYFM